MQDYTYSAPFVHIVDRNCPTYDIRDLVQMSKLSYFLIQVRANHQKELVARFESVKQEFQQRWMDNDKSLDWTVNSQREENAFKEVRKGYEEERK